MAVANLVFPWFSIMFKVTVMLAPAAPAAADAAAAAAAAAPAATTATRWYEYREATIRNAWRGCRRATREQILQK